MQLKALTLPDVKQVVHWRNQQKEMLRTSFLLTEDMQEQFYKDVVCNRQANSRYFGIYNFEKFGQFAGGELIEVDRNVLIGMCGLENIQWENRLAEISLITSPGYGYDNMSEILKLILHEAFMNIGLENVFTEVYKCSPYHEFWIDQANKQNAYLAVLPNRKYWSGKYYDSEYISFNKERYNENTLSKS
jgi:RimJ/RimL family protein N-acetyltransferase